MLGGKDLAWEQEISLEKAKTIFTEFLTREKENFKQQGIEGVMPFLQVSLVGKNKVYSSLLCIDLVEKDGDLIFKTANVINSFSIDKRTIERITLIEKIEGKIKILYLIFQLVGGMKCQICLSKEVISG
jgi:hypothetical protein